MTMPDIEWLRREIDQRFASMIAQTELTRSAMEHRLEGMNQFRDQLRDQAATLITRAEFRALETRVAELSDRMNRGEGQSSGARDFKAEHRLDWGFVVQTIVMLLMMASILIVALHG